MCVQIDMIPRVGICEARGKRVNAGQEKEACCRDCSDYRGKVKGEGSEKRENERQPSRVCEVAESCPQGAVCGADETMYPPSHHHHHFSQ